MAEKEATVEAAQAAEQQLRRQLSSSSTSGAALREAQAESDALRQQLEESVRKYSTVKQARERAMTEVSLWCLLRIAHGPFFNKFYCCENIRVSLHVYRVCTECAQYLCIYTEYMCISALLTASQMCISQLCNQILILQIIVLVSSNTVYAFVEDESASDICG